MLPSLAASGGGASGGAGAISLRHSGVSAAAAAAARGRMPLGIGPDGLLRLRTGPLTTRWAEYERRPAVDDFHDDEEDAAEAQSLRKRKRPDV